MPVYCPICLAQVTPDEYSGLCECPQCEECFEPEDGLSAEEVRNIGCPGGDL